MYTRKHPVFYKLHIWLLSRLLLFFQHWLFHYFASMMTFLHFFNARAVWLSRKVKKLHICGLWWLYCSYQSFPTASWFTQRLCLERRKENCNYFLWGKIFSFLLESDSQLWALCHKRVVNVSDSLSHSYSLSYLSGKKNVCGEIAHWQPAARLNQAFKRLPDIFTILIVKILTLAFMKTFVDSWANLFPRCNIRSQKCKNILKWSRVYMESQR